ncbi:MAG: hypothetical protein GXP42_18420 [Chloroflexi bacterium]|nr:hypothetical protein [Chloroflexota bacterium]
MMESVGYQLIKEEGLEEGYKKGFQEGREEGREEGYREGLLRAIASGLDFKFGVEGLKLMLEIREIQDMVVLDAIERAIHHAETVDEVRSIYQG